MYDTCLLSKHTGRKHENKEDAARYPTPASKRCFHFHNPIRPLSTVSGALDHGSFGYLMLLGSARPQRPPQPTCYPSHLQEKLTVTVCELSLMGNPEPYYNHLWKPSIWHSKCFVAGGGSKSGAASLGDWVLPRYCSPTSPSQKFPS